MEGMLSFIRHFISTCWAAVSKPFLLPYYFFIFKLISIVYCVLMLY